MKKLIWLVIAAGLGFAVASFTLPRDVIETVKVVNSNKECPVVRGEECNPEIEYVTVTNTVVKEVPKKLTQAQVDGIAKLALKPVEYWSVQDHANWDYATNKAPIIIKNVEKIVERVVTFCPAPTPNSNSNSNTNINSNTNSGITIRLNDRFNVRERFEELREDLKDRGITMKDGKLVININRSR